MKAHVLNPWTRSPSLMVNLSVEHVQQLSAALEKVDIGALADDNQRWVLAEIRIVLKHALETRRGHGLKGVVP